MGDTEGYGLIVVALCFLAFCVGLTVARFTQLRGLYGALVGMLAVFLLTMAWLGFIEMALLAALIAALPSLAGAHLGAKIRKTT